MHGRRYGPVGMNLLSDPVFRAAFDRAYNSIVITDADFDGGGPFVLHCNPAFCAMTGYAQEEWIGRSPRILQGAATDRTVIDRLRRQIRAGKFFEGSTINYRKDGGRTSFNGTSHRFATPTATSWPTSRFSRTSPPWQRQTNGIEPRFRRSGGRPTV